MLKRLNLFIFIDALGWELAQRHRFLETLLPVRTPVESIFGYSSTCDPTILTGVMPREHGHFSFFYYDPAHSPFGFCRWLGLLPRAITRRGRVRRVISRLVGKLYGYTGYFQLYNMPFNLLPYFNYSEKRDIYQPGGINGGQPTIFDLLRAEQIPFHLSNWRCSETENLAALEHAIDAGEITFAYLYMAAMDAILHRDGTDASTVSEKIAWYAERVTALRDRAQRQYDEVRLHVFSDHGMTDVTSDVEVMAPINRLGLRFGVDYAAVYDSTMARFWFLNEAARGKIVDTLATIPAGHLLNDAELAAWGCTFPDRTYGDAFFLLDPGALLCPSFMGETHLRGMHGYDPTDRDALALYAANVAPRALPRRLDDFYRIMRDEALGNAEATAA